MVCDVGMTAGNLTQSNTDGFLGGSKRSSVGGAHEVSGVASHALAQAKHRCRNHCRLPGRLSLVGGGGSEGGGVGEGECSFEEK